MAGLSFIAALFECVSAIGCSLMLFVLSLAASSAVSSDITLSTCTLCNAKQQLCDAQTVHSAHVQSSDGFEFKQHCIVDMLIVWHALESVQLDRCVLCNYTTLRHD